MFYKVCITQVLNGKIIGEALLVEDFATVEAANDAALEYSKVYDYPCYEIRGYNPKNINFITFNEIDTGKLALKVCQKDTN